MKRKKVKWLNVFKLVVLVASIILVIHDLWLVGFSCFFTNELVGFTWLGLITHIMAWFIIATIIEDFKEEIEKRPNHRK